MNNVYEFKGKKYSLKEIDLELMHGASPLLIKYRELLYKHTCNIDTSVLDETEYEITQLKQAVTDLNSEGEKEIVRIAELESKIRDRELKLKTPALVSLRKYLNDMEAMAMYEILTDAEFIAGIINSILKQTGNNERADITPNDLMSKDSLSFIKTVIEDFFLLVMKNKSS